MFVAMIIGFVVLVVLLPAAFVVVWTGRRAGRGALLPGTVGMAIGWLLLLFVWEPVADGIATRDRLEEILGVRISPDLVVERSERPGDALLGDGYDITVWQLDEGDLASVTASVRGRDFPSAGDLPPGWLRRTWRETPPLAGDDAVIALLGGGWTGGPSFVRAPPAVPGEIGPIVDPVAGASTAHGNLYAMRWNEPPSEGRGRWVVDGDLYLLDLRRGWLIIVSLRT